MIALPANFAQMPEDERLAAAALAMFASALKGVLSPKKRRLVLQDLFLELVEAQRENITHHNVVSFGTRQAIEKRDARRELLRKAAGVAYGIVCSELDRMPRPTEQARSKAGIS
jgi:hypothetical protein